MGAPSPRALGRVLFGTTMQYGVPLIPFAIRLFVRLLPLWVFLFVWQYVRRTFYETAGLALHRPAWPLFRTWLVWAMFAFPIWGAAMLAISFIQRRLGTRLNVLRERHQDQYYQLLNTSLRPLLGTYQDDQDDLEAEVDLAEVARRNASAANASAMSTRPSYASRVPGLGAFANIIYLSTAVLGMMLWVTRECGKDWQHRADIDRASTHRRPGGYGNGGAYRSTAAVGHRSDHSRIQKKSSSLRCSSTTRRFCPSGRNSSRACVTILDLCVPRTC